MDTHYNKRFVFFILFAISGFSGLIYESIWSHYLKLFLGHAAYAQTLVLAIFMGGMALGSIICSQYSTRWKNLLLGYAIAEGLIGTAALLFHPLFVGITGWSYDSIMPALGSPGIVGIYKWTLASLLILPQSILLGMTFPLMSTGLLRRFPQQPGRSISILYFSNSIGAAVGVLASGFVLIEYVGLPGTLLSAGLINLILAVLVWRLVKDHPAGDPVSQIKTQETHTNNSRGTWFVVMLSIAFFTGAASFIYEISWIRMLSLVLGSSTHAFELMLSAFIFGLAFGGLWIRNRIGTFTKPILVLAIIQLAMGALALGTIPLYDQSFELMRWLVANLEKTDLGYSLFNLSSHGIALMIMLPTTFCAGMTLPLITFLLLGGGHGEKSIGAVYAANTIGAIVGVMFAIHLGLPLLGLKNALWTGAAIDMVLGLILLYYAGLGIRTLAGASIGTAAVLLGALGLTQLDLYKTGSGVYRTGKLISESDTQILYHKDGKAATVDLHRDADGHVNIRTNGKVDANINMSGTPQVSTDEPTMVLAAAVPLSLNPTAQTAAVIGLGSGLSTHTLLTSSAISTVDTIEIEPAMVEAAAGFRPRVELAYSDARSHIFIDDAKTYFSTHNKKYDIIISEPSNPWVSGTAGLFTEEFYRLIPNYLRENGILVQWIQLYELDMELVATIAKALTPHFSDYVIYTATDRDILLVARVQGRVPRSNLAVFNQPQLQAELKKIHVRTLDDLNLRRLGSKQVFQPLFDSYSSAANSDYYPVLDLGAAKTRFLNAHAGGLVALSYSNPPALKYLGASTHGNDTTNITQFHTPTKTLFTRVAMAIRDRYLSHHDAIEQGSNTGAGKTQSMLLPLKFRDIIARVNRIFFQCESADSQTWITNLLELGNATIPFLSSHELSKLWGSFAASPCYSQLLPQQQDWISLFQAISQKQHREMAELSQWLLQHNIATSPDHTEFLAATALLGEILRNNHAKARQLILEFEQKYALDFQNKLLLRLLAAHSE
ncbi:MAG: fused MFS/spermidine synthase [Gammaproteobacteria bacterium]|nr:fused MFS/spermidine synthase [Gammaproteobacteria bacterium]MDH5800826.1 fused MFS/spermidine synthase [Gammaproteobacteria bacterium]